jgi:hypothetical protein
MTTRQVDVKHVAKLPSIKSWRSTELTKRLVFKLFGGLRHGELVIHDKGETHRFGGDDLSIAPSASVTIHEPSCLFPDSHGRNHGRCRSLH